MEKFVSVVFTRSHTWDSVLVRAWMRSRFSHCGIYDHVTGNVIEATPNGVIERPLSCLLDEASQFEVVKIKCREPKSVIRSARKQLGKPYDWKAIFGLWLRRNWRSEQAFFCSELIAWAFEDAGHPIFRREAHKITPEMLYLPRFER